MSLSLKHNKIVFVGALMIDAETPQIAKAFFDLQKPNVQVWANAKMIISQPVTAIAYEQLNEMISQVHVTCPTQSFDFQVGIFPDESSPIDNVTDSVNETFSVTNPQKLFEDMKSKGVHFIIGDMVREIQAHLPKPTA